jgi:hypothetical protein
MLIRPSLCSSIPVDSLGCIHGLWHRWVYSPGVCMDACCVTLPPLSISLRRPGCAGGRVLLWTKTSSGATPSFCWPAGLALSSPIELFWSLMRAGATTFPPRVVVADPTLHAVTEGASPSCWLRLPPIWAARPCPPWSLRRCRVRRCTDANRPPFHHASPCAALPGSCCVPLLSS